MKTLFTQKLAALLLSILVWQSFNSKAFADETPKKVKVNLVVSGRPVAKNEFLNRQDNEFSLNVQPTDETENKELVVRDFEITLVRGGKRVANRVVIGSGSIKDLATLAKNEDVYVIEIKEVFEKTSSGALVPYAQGRLILNYLFYDFDVTKK